MKKKNTANQRKSALSPTLNIDMTVTLEPKALHQLRNDPFTGSDQKARKRAIFKDFFFVLGAIALFKGSFHGRQHGRYLSGSRNPDDCLSAFQPVLSFCHVPSLRSTLGQQRAEKRSKPAFQWNMLSSRIKSCVFWMENIVIRFLMEDILGVEDLKIP